MGSKLKLLVNLNELTKQDLSVNKNFIRQRSQVVYKRRLFNIAKQRRIQLKKLYGFAKTPSTLNTPHVKHLANLRVFKQGDIVLKPFCTNKPRTHLSSVAQFRLFQRNWARTYAKINRYVINHLTKLNAAGSINLDWAIQNFKQRDLVIQTLQTVIHTTAIASKLTAINFKNLTKQTRFQLNKITKTRTPLFKSFLVVSPAKRKLKKWAGLRFFKPTRSVIIHIKKVHTSIKQHLTTGQKNQSIKEFNAYLNLRSRDFVALLSVFKRFLMTAMKLGDASYVDLPKLAFAYYNVQRLHKFLQPKINFKYNIVSTNSYKNLVIKNFKNKILFLTRREIGFRNKILLKQNNALNVKGNLKHKDNEWAAKLRKYYFWHKKTQKKRRWDTCMNVYKFWLCLVNSAKNFKRKDRWLSANATKLYNLALHIDEDRNQYAYFRTYSVNLKLYDTVKLVLRPHKLTSDQNSALYINKSRQLKTSILVLNYATSQYKNLIKSFKNNRSQVMLKKLRDAKHSLKLKLTTVKQLKYELSKLRAIHTKETHVNVLFDPLLSTKTYQPWFKVIKNKNGSSTLKIVNPYDTQTHLINIKAANVVYLHLINNRNFIKTRNCSQVVLANSYRSLYIHNKDQYISLYNKYLSNKNKRQAKLHGSKFIKNFYTINKHIKSMYNPLWSLATKRYEMSANVFAGKTPYKPQLLRNRKFKLKSRPYNLLRPGKVKYRLNISNNKKRKFKKKTKSRSLNKKFKNKAQVVIRKSKTKHFKAYKLVQPFAKYNKSANTAFKNSAVGRRQWVKFTSTNPFMLNVNTGFKFGTLRSNQFYNKSKIKESKFINEVSENPDLTTFKRTLVLNLQNSKIWNTHFLALIENVPLALKLISDKKLVDFNNGNIFTTFEERIFNNGPVKARNTPAKSFEHAQLKLIKARISNYLISRGYKIRPKYRHLGGPINALNHKHNMQAIERGALTLAFKSRVELLQRSLFFKANNYNKKVLYNKHLVPATKTLGILKSSTDYGYQLFVNASNRLKQEIKWWNYYEFKAFRWKFYVKRWYSRISRWKRLAMFRRMMRAAQRNYRKLRKNFLFIKLMRASFTNILGITESELLDKWALVRRGNNNNSTAPTLSRFNQTLHLKMDSLALLIGMAPNRPLAQEFVRFGGMRVNGMVVTNTNQPLLNNNILQIDGRVNKYIRHLYKATHWDSVRARIKFVGFLQASWSNMTFIMIRWPHNHELMQESIMNERWTRFFIRYFPVRIAKYKKAKVNWYKY